MNLLLAGIAFIFATITKSISGFFMGFAIQNLFLAALNVVFICGLDGEKILSALLGRKDFVFSAITTILNKKETKALWNKGYAGKAEIVTIVCICAIQIAFPVVLLINLAEVISWITDIF